jgi:hypothetical protein
MSKSILVGEEVESGEHVHDRSEICAYSLEGTAASQMLGGAGA